MILVTVGTHNIGFDRLVRAVDELAGLLEEKVIIQRGASTYQPRYAEYFDFTSSQRMESLTSESRLLICQAGAGAILVALRAGRPMIVVPRLKRYGESIDDHQLQLAAVLDAERRAIVVHDVTAVTLREAVVRAEQLMVRPPKEGSLQLVDAIRKQLRAWDTHRPRVAPLLGEDI